MNSNQTEEGLRSSLISSDNTVDNGIAAISWFTPALGAKMGYGVAAIGLIEALMNNQCYVGFNSRHPKVHVSFVQPEWYMGVDGQYKIGYTPWESTVIPDTWVYYMQQQDEIWTTSNFCFDVFSAYEVNQNLHMIPHGINPDIWKINDRTLASQFRFLHVGGPTERKGGQKVVDAFLELFDGRDDIQLIMKSNGPSEARWRTDNFYGGNAKNHPQITVFENEMTEEQLVSLYHQSHCLVYPTNGEGFGFIPFQAIATGLPTITTNLTATADFADMSMPLNATWCEGNGLHLGLWAEPDLDHLRRLMQSAVDDWENHKKKAMHSARIIHSTQTWNHIAHQVISLLGDRLYERN